MLRFVSIFVVLLLVLYAVRQTAPVAQELLPAITRFNAWLIAIVLSLLGQQVTCVDNLVQGRDFTLTVGPGCDGSEPWALFVAAVLAFPAQRTAKLLGLVAGTAAIVALNLVRLSTLYFVGTHFPQAFDVMHVDLWQVIFVLCVVGLWMGWALWAARHRRAKPASPTTA